MNYSLILQCLRMCRDSSLAELAGISLPYSLSWTGSGLLEAGELLTLNTMEWPSADDGYSACSLAEILEPHVAPKYYLSAQACRGILRRAEKRGRTLPPPLEAALRAMAQTDQDGAETTT